MLQKVNFLRVSRKPHASSYMGQHLWSRYFNSNHFCAMLCHILAVLYCNSYALFILSQTLSAAVIVVKPNTQAYMVSSSCMYRSSPPPPSTSWSNLRMISFSNYRRKQRERGGGEQREMREQMRRGIEEEINYAGIIKASLLLFCPASQETEGGEQCVWGQCFSAIVDFVCLNVNLQASCVNFSAHRQIQICVRFLPCGSFQSVNVHMWSCQRRWEWWPFSTLPPGSKSSPGWDPPCREWSRSCDCLKDTPTKSKRTGKSISEPFHPCSSPVCLMFALGTLQVSVYQNIPIQRTIWNSASYIQNIPH